MKLRCLLSIALVSTVGCGTATHYPARTPAPLPAGAVVLDIQTAAPVGLDPGRIETCPDAQLEPVRLARKANQLTFLLVATDGPRAVIWPRGFSARVYQGRAELIAPDGKVVAAEGDVLDGIGGSGPIPDAFEVCTVGSTTYGPAS